MENVKINKREKVGSVAIQQALREFHCSYRIIAGICRISPRTVWNNCNGKDGILRWEDRTKKEEALRIAENLIYKTLL